MEKKITWKKLLLNLDFLISIVCMILLTLLTSSGTFLRYFANAPIVWEEEIQMILVIQIVFWGASAAFRTRNHIVIEIVMDSLPEKAQKAGRILVDLITVFALSLVIYIEMERVLQLLESGRVTSILKIPQAYNYLGISIACIFMLVNFIRSEYLEYRNGKEAENT